MAAALSPAAPQVFADIYRHAAWATHAQGEGHSGVGSTLRSTLIYRTFLQQFLNDNAIRSVVDAGCGDWEFSQTLDWSGIDYKGFDVVESAIAKAKKFAKPNIAFFVGNVGELGLPPADLLLCKHVLQHLPTRDVQTFLTQIKKYRHVLLTNSVNVQTMSATNVDIAVGECRSLDPTTPPFNLYGAKVLTYWDGHSMHQVVHIAESLAITGVSPFGEGEAKACIESRGFSDVTELKRGDLGLWLAKARKDGRAVEIVLDVQGKVFFRDAKR
jgi:SAM-dependent methyltransferase